MTVRSPGKGKNACSERLDGNALTFEPRGKDSDLLKIEVKELNRVSRMTGPVSKNMDQGVETFIQSGWKLFRRVQEALMKLTGHGYRQFPLESVAENEALEDQRHHRQKWTKTLKNKICQDSGNGGPDLTTGS